MYGVQDENFYRDYNDFFDARFAGYAREQTSYHQSDFRAASNA
ncbi:hypothetical protein [Enterobacter sp. S-33]|nr:hypothetical protein [Enterobacter sp. S-33]